MTPFRSTSIPRGVYAIVFTPGPKGGWKISARQVSGGFLPISRRTMAPGTPGWANQMVPSTGFGTIEYEPPRMRRSSAGSAGSFCSVYAPILPSPLLSTISGHQP